MPRTFASFSSSGVQHKYATTRAACTGEKRNTTLCMNDEEYDACGILTIYLRSFDVASFSRARVHFLVGSCLSRSVCVCDDSFEYLNRYDANRCDRLRVARLRLLDRVHDVHSLADEAEHRVLVVQPRARHGRDEELAREAGSNEMKKRWRCEGTTTQHRACTLARMLDPRPSASARSLVHCAYL
jgi:hypothetical protein